MRALTILVAVALGMAGTAGWAQSETGTRIGGKPAKVPTTGSNADRARAWLAGYAACVAKRDPKRVAEVLDAEIGSAPPVFDLVESNYDACLSTGGDADELRMSPRILRGALYAERVTKMVDRMPADAAQAAPLALPPIASLSTDDQLRVSLVRFGECVMHADPAKALAFVAADPGKAGETNALQVITPLLGGCLDEGVQIKLSLPILEAALAEAIYRTVHQNGGGKR